MLEGATVVKGISGAGSPMVIPTVRPAQSGVRSINISGVTAKSVTSSPNIAQASIRPKVSAVPQTVVLVDKDGNRSTIQLPPSAVSIGKDGKSMITLPQSHLQVCVCSCCVVSSLYLSNTERLFLF